MNATGARAEQKRRKYQDEFEKRIERVGLALRRPIATRAGHIFPGRMVIKRIARRLEADVHRQLDRQIAFRHRHRAAFRAVDDRDRAAPIALARHPPIAQPIGDRALAAAELFEPFAGGALRLSHPEAVEEIRVEQRPVLDIGLLADREPCRVGTRRQHHRDHRQPVLAGEFEVALVVRRTPEDRAGAVFHQHEIRDPDRDRAISIKRMDGFESGRIAAFLRGLDHRLAGAHAVAFGDEGGKLRVVLGQSLRQRVVRRQCQERGAEEGVRPRREDFDPLVPAGDIEPDPRTFGSADPVLLHQPHPLGPALEAADSVEQLLGEQCDAQRPLRQQPLFDDRAGTPAATVDDLLVREDGVFDRVPVDPGFPAVGKPRREEVEKHLLLVAVIFRVAGRYLARPVIGEPHAFELSAHRRDVLTGPDRRVNFFGDRRVFRRQAKSIPAHRMQDVEPLRAVVAGDQIPHRIVADVADMQLARRVGEHLEDIVFRPAGLGGDLEQPALAPDALPFRFGFSKIVSGHRPIKSFGGFTGTDGRCRQRLPRRSRPHLVNKDRTGLRARPRSTPSSPMPASDETARLPAHTRWRASLGSVLFHPGPLELTRPSQDRSFEIVLDLSRDRGRDPLPSRRELLPIYGDRDRIRPELARKDEYGDTVALVGFIRRRIPVGDEHAAQRVLRAELDKIHRIERCLPRDRADRAAGPWPRLAFRRLLGEAEHRPERRVGVDPRRWVRGGGLRFGGTGRGIGCGGLAGGRARGAPGEDQRKTCGDDARQAVMSSRHPALPQG